MSTFESNLIEWLEKILLERFGYLLVIYKNDSTSISLSLSGEIGLIKFDQLSSMFFTQKPSIPCVEWHSESEGFTSMLGMPLPAPGIDCLPLKLIEKAGDCHVIHYDILGLIFWVLSRQEEVGRKDLDKHGRFQGTSSHAFKHGYLDRPIVDEWLDLLGQVILRQWPHLKLKKHKPKVVVTCDVDRPYLQYSKFLDKTLIKATGDILKRQSLSQAYKNLQRYVFYKRGVYRYDPLMSALDWIMSVNEDVGNRVVFYFIPESKHPTYESGYSLSESAIEFLIKKISERGHEIGMHGSYASHQNREQVLKEVALLNDGLESVGVVSSRLGNRQHYLRWDVATTAVNLENAGVIYDSSLGYADHAGFRCGTCHEFPMFDPVKGRMLAIRQRPLIMMECSVISQFYMGMGYTEESLNYMHMIKERCYKAGGSFTLLWHNSHLNSERDKAFYLSLISKYVG